MQLPLSQASQLLAEAPSIIQPTARLRALLSLRNRDVFEKRGPEMSQTEQRFMSFKANGLRVAVGADLPVYEPKRTLQR